MRGNVIGFDLDTNTGAISGHDGNRYDFVTQDWHGRIPPRHGDVADFQAQGGRALDIYLIEPQYVRPTIGQFYFSPFGRMSRAQYWLRFWVPYFVIYVALNIAADMTDDDSTAHKVIGAILSIYALLALWPSVAVLVKRMHDRNRPGWLCLILYVPTMLFFVLLIIWLAPAIAGAAATGAFAPPALDARGIMVILLAMISGVVGLWFFVEFGCLRGTVGPNRYGPDPIR